MYGAMTDVSLRLSEDEQEEVRTHLQRLSSRPGSVPSITRLLSDWREFVDNVERGYQLTVYDYTNDLSVRTILHQLLSVVSDDLRTKLENALRSDDDRLRRVTRLGKKPLVGQEEGGGQMWWRFRVPWRMGSELERDLRSRGFLGEKHRG